MTKPVRRQRVRAVIAEPVAGQRLTRGDVTIRGLAWSGVAPVTHVQVSVGARPWQPARLLGRLVSDGWRRWELRTNVNESGATSVRARAIDRSGRTQPQQPKWNRLGYGANAVHTVTIQVV
jgi:hypothetical protein